MQWEVLDRIRSQFSNLTHRQRQAAEYLTRDLQRLAFASAATIAKEARVSEATVVRLAKSLGFEGYAEMQESIRNQANRRLEELGMARRNRLADDFSTPDRILETVAKRHQENIHATVAGISAQQFHAAAEMIASADTVMVAAHHWSRSVGLMLVDLLRSVPVSADLFGGQEEREWQLSRITPRSVVVGIGFPRYPQETVALLEAARQRGARVIAITDSVTSPLARDAASLLLVAGLSALPGSDYFAGAATVLYALHVAVSLQAGQGEDPRTRSLQQAYRQLSTFVVSEDRD